MELSYSDFNEGPSRPSARLVRAGAGPLLALVVAGLLTEVMAHDEAYAGLSLLALVGAAGCLVSLTHRLSRNPESLAGPDRVSPLPRPAAPVPGLFARGEDWPLLVALLFGPLVVLLAGLGGWV